jgi:serine/threonine-protein kinase
MSLWDELRERNVARIVEFWTDLRERRIFRIMVGYLAAGWLALQGADMLAGRDILSELAYRLVLVAYLAGIPAALIIGWFHGEKGAQRLTLLEVGLLAVVGAGALTGGAAVVQAYQTAPETLADASPLDLRDVAVTYFEDVSADADLEAVADGLTESLIGKLQRVGSLEVVSRRGVLPFRGSGVSPDSVARALEVGTVITGNVDGEGDQLRITTELVDGHSGGVVAREVVRTSREELLSARESVAEGLARQLRQFIGEEVRFRTERAGTGDVTAWVLHQRGQRVLREAREAARHGAVDSALARFDRADSLLAQAGAADGAWAEPVVERARVAYRRARALDELAGDRHEALRAGETGIEHAERALAMSPGHPEALELRGTIRYWTLFLGVAPDPERRRALLDSARADLEAAVDADPTLASAYSTLSHLYYQPGVADLAGVVLAARRAYETDAYLENADRILSDLFEATMDLGQFDQAERWCSEGREAFPADPRFRMCRLRLMASPAAEPGVDAAWRITEAVDSLAPPAERRFQGLLARMYVAGVLARAGLPDSARAVVSRARADVTSEVDPDRFLLGVEAYVRTLLGEPDQAVDLLSRYVTAHPGHEFGVAGEISWRWRDLQDHPGFRKIRRTE